MTHWTILLLLPVFAVGFGCKKKTDTSANEEPSLVFIFKFDSTQTRLDNLGQPSSVPAGHSAQTPRFNKISSHYVEMTGSEYDPIGGGTVLFRSKETKTGGSDAIDFNSSTVVKENQPFLRVPLKNIGPGLYKWLRVSLAYQNYDINYKTNVSGTDYYLTGTLASFVGFNTFIKSYTIKNLSVNVNANKSQGYWGFETVGQTYTGQAPAGATTVPNPLASTSPIPSGSCVVTGKITNNLEITGKETKDIVVVVSLSNNKSFEWSDLNGDGWYEPSAGDNVVDMGIRGLIPTVIY